jgi:hypothetical protein
VNLPAQWVTVAGTLLATDELIGSTRFTVRAGTISYLSVMPSPTL